MCYNFMIFFFLYLILFCGYFLMIRLIRCEHCLFQISTESWNRISEYLSKQIVIVTAKYAVKHWQSINNLRIILSPVDGACSSSGVRGITSPAHYGHRGPEHSIQPCCQNEKVVRSHRHFLPWREKLQVQYSWRLGKSVNCGDAGFIASYSRQVDDMF